MSDWVERMRPAIRLVAIALLPLAALGIYVLLILFSGLLVLIPIGIFVGLIVLRIGWPRIARALGCVIVPLLTLAGIDWIWAIFSLPTPGPLAGLSIAAFVIAVAAIAYLRSCWVHRAARHPLAWALATALFLVVLPPLVVWLAAKGKHEDVPVGKPLSELEVVAVGAETKTPRVASSATLNGWIVHSWAGTAQGEAVRWARGRPPLAPGADHVLLLFVDGAPVKLSGTASLPNVGGRDGEVRRWLAVADQATNRDRDIPAVAVLQTTDERRLRDWRRRLKPADEERPDRRRHGYVLSLQKLGDAQTIEELGLKIAVESATASQDLALALRYRPALFFDSRERYATPLNVDGILKSGAFRLCDDHQPILASCKELHEASDLENGPNHLGFDTSEVAKLTEDSTIYVHVTRGRDPKGAARIYLDYWWYLPDNPSNAADGALCGAGLVIAEITCFNHQSDWEGVTIVLDPGSATDTPVEAHYSEHSFRVRYTWPALIDLWGHGPTHAFAPKVDTAHHAIVFVAAGTHAAYPTVCRKKHCPSLQFTENRYDGGTAWVGNPGASPLDPDCEPICVAPLPTDARGRATLWNAYEGHWGTTRCNLTVLCTSTQAPRSPAHQSRYRYPWCAARTVGFKAGRARYLSPRVAPDDCPKKAPP